MIRHRVLIDEGRIRARVAALADTIAADLDGRPPILLGLLTGSFVFLADLARALAVRGVEPRIDFLSVGHYGAGTNAERPVEIVKDTALPLAGEVVLLVDDIYDSGKSMAHVIERLRDRNPTWLRTCVLLDKPSRHAVSMKVDYVGFEVEDVWLIGYGLDLDGEGRALPYIGAIEESKK